MEQQQTPPHSPRITSPPSDPSADPHSPPPEVELPTPQVRENAKQDPVQSAIAETASSSTDKEPAKGILVCEFCGHQFNRRSNLNAHLRVHTHQKPFKCGVCDRRFTQRGNMELHTRTHTGLRPYKCGVCNRAFSSCSNMRRHWRHLHPDVALPKLGTKQLQNGSPEKRLYSNPSDKSFEFAFEAVTPSSNNGSTVEGSQPGPTQTESTPSTDKTQQASCLNISSGDGSKLVISHGEPNMLQNGFPATQQPIKLLPPLAQQLPSLVHQVPLVSKQLPPLAQQLPPLAQQLLPFTQQLPPLPQQLPPLPQQLPSLAQQLPPLAQQLPSLAQQLPALAEKPLLMHQQSAPPAQQSLGQETLIQHAPVQQGTTANQQETVKYVPLPAGTVCAGMLYISQIPGNPSYLVPANYDGTQIPAQPTVGSPKQCMLSTIQNPVQ